MIRIFFEFNLIKAYFIVFSFNCYFNYLEEMPLIKVSERIYVKQWYELILYILLSHIFLRYYVRPLRKNKKLFTSTIMTFFFEENGRIVTFCNLNYKIHT